jgi:phosphoribosylformimino-5-aminoimidazole carboxamide ribotide isomerase
MSDDRRLAVIPVIDLQGGKVVAARLGNRAEYRPIASPLGRSAQPIAVVDALLCLHPFGSLYVADLDAIGGAAGHWAIIQELSQRYPEVQLWVDNGLKDLPRLAALARPVLGSESLADLDALRNLRHRHPRAILSLDYRNERLVGPKGLDTRPHLWPADLIVMTLSRVGSGRGPDLERLAAIQRAAPSCQVYAAGGVRDADDLRQLAALGVAGALISTALHLGQIGAAELAGR